MKKAGGLPEEVNTLQNSDLPPEWRMLKKGLRAVFSVENHLVKSLRVQSSLSIGWYFKQGIQPPKHAWFPKYRLHVQQRKGGFLWRGFAFFKAHFIEGYKRKGGQFLLPRVPRDPPHADDFT